MEEVEDQPDNFSFLNEMKSIIGAKKGQVQTIAPAIIALVIAAVFLILGMIVLQELRDTDVVKKANSRTVVNESVLSVGDSGDTLTGNTQPGANAFSIIVAINASNGAIVPSTNYTVTDNGIMKARTGVFNGSNMNVTYVFKYGDEAFTAGNDTLQGLANFSDFWEIIVLAIVISVVIGLLLIVFGGGRKQAR